ncbi:unnamed protein product, partial [marine sediment metagenome]
VRMIMNTEDMVDGGYFADSDAVNIKTVEFVDSNSNSMYYWCKSALDVPDNFDTDNTTVYLATQTAVLAADTTHTCYMYIDVARDGETSTNYGEEKVFDFFEGFETAKPNLADFLTEYDGINASGGTDNEWVVNTTDTAFTVVVASSVLTLTGVTAATWEGIAATDTFEDFTCLIRYTTDPGDYAYSGMVDAGGIDAGSNEDLIATTGKATQELVTRLDGAAARVVEATYYTFPFDIEYTKFEGTYNHALYRSDADERPDSTTGIYRYLATDEAHK